MAAELITPLSLINELGPECNFDLSRMLARRFNLDIGAEMSDAVIIGTLALASPESSGIILRHHHNLLPNREMLQFYSRVVDPDLKKRLISPLVATWRYSLTDIRFSSVGGIRGLIPEDFRGVRNIGKTGSLFIVEAFKRPEDTQTS